MKPLLNVTYWRNPDLPGIETCRVVRSRHEFPNHTHEDYYAIGLMESGGCYCLGTGREEGFVTPGSIGLINPGLVHSGVAPKGTKASYRMLYVDVAEFRKIAADITDGNDAPPEFQSVVAWNRWLRDRLIRVARLLAEQGGRLETESTMVEAFSRLVAEFGGVRRNRERTGREPGAVRIAREFLSEDLDRKITLDDIAGQTGLSRYHLLRVFKREAGVPPHAFRTQRRIEAAKHLLTDGMPIAQAALETGFSDQSHFTNQFRRIVGATPTQYLQR